MFSLLATLAHWKINPRLWLTWYLESCAAVGGKAPAGYSTIPALESLTGTSRGIGGANRVTIHRRHILTLPIIGLSVALRVAPLPPLPPRRRSRPAPGRTSALTGWTKVYATFSPKGFLSNRVGRQDAN